MFQKQMNHISPYNSPGFMSLWLIFFLCVAGFGQANAQETEIPDTLKNDKKIDLEQSIKIALANNTQIKQALLSVKDADQQVRTAWSSVLPEVTANASYTRNLEVPVNFIPEVVFNPDADPDNLVPVAFGTDNNWNGSLSVSQTIFNGQAFVGINSSELFKTAQAESLRATAQQIVTQTRLAYNQVLIAQERVRLQQAQIDRIRENLSDARARLEQGFVDEYAVLQLEVQLGNLEPQLTQARYAVDNARRNLLDVMGLPVKLPLQVKGNLNTYQIHTETAEMPVNKSIKEVSTMTSLQLEADSVMNSNLAELRADLRLIDVQQQLQEKQIKARRSQYLPTLSASYNLQYTASQAGNPVFFGTEDSRARSQTVMLNFSVPIFQGFERDASIQRAKIQLRQLELQEYQAEQTARKEITSAKENIRQAYETATAREQALNQASEGYDRALLRYKNGLGSQQEVTDAQIQLREAELNYAQMVFDYLSAKTNYDMAVGRVPFVGEDPDTVRKKIN